MGRKGRGISLEAVRRGLLLALLVFVALVGALYVLGRIGRPSDAPSGDDELDGGTRGNLVLSGTGFEYGLTKGDREVFHIRAQRILSDRAANYELEGVQLSMEREDGSLYHLTSDLAVYNLDDEEASFEGNVRFLGPNEVELTAEGLELRDEGDLLVSSSPVEFSFLGRFVGSANRLRINPDRNLFILAGDVEVDTLPGDSTPMSLRCRRFSFERDDRTLRAEGAVVLTRRQDTLSARRLSVILTEDESQIEFVRARWDVQGAVQQIGEDGQIGTVELEGREMSVDFDPATEDPRRAELVASRSSPAVLSVKDQTGLMREIRAGYLVGHFEAGALRRSEAFDHVVITERLTFDPSVIFRTACADRADAVLGRGGTLDEVHLHGMVLLQEDAVQAFGDEAHGKSLLGEMELVGEPAWLLRDGEQLEAPRIVYFEKERSVTAEEKVRAVLGTDGGIDLATDRASRKEPVRIEAQRAEWSDSPSTVTFSGQVRAWQGENFLVSDRLSGEPETSRVTATGRVKTVWRPDPEASNSEGLPPEPLEVTAEEMTYDRDRRLLVYSGNARAVQLKRTLRCATISLYLAEDEGFEQMTCEGQTVLQDGESGNTVTGERAMYQPGGRRVRVEGSPVTLRDAQGTEIQGRVLIYDFETATARVETESSGPASQTERQ